MTLRAALMAPFSALSSHRSLTFALAWREVLGRYRGASFGLAWSLISPFLMLSVYTFAFGTVMGGRWPAVRAGDTHFSIILFAGLIVHGFFAECVNRAPMLVVSNPSYVKRVVFPLDVLPWPMVLSALFHTGMNLLVFLALRLALDHDFSWTTLFFPLVMLPLVVLTLGLSWFLAATGVYLRDIAQVTGVATMAMLFLSSAMMPVENVPEAYRWVFVANPLTFIIDQARAVLLWEQMPDWIGLAKYLVAASAFAYVARAWFGLTRKGFADVL